MAKAVNVKGMEIDTGNVEYVSRDEILPEIISDVIVGSDIDPVTKGKLEKFVNNEACWENESEYHRLLGMKRQLAYRAKDVQGLYEPRSNRVFVIKDAVEEWVPYFKHTYGSDWEEELAKYRDILEVHECSHRKQFSECPEFSESRERLKTRKHAIIDELIKDRISIKRQGDKLNVNVPKHSLKKLEEKKPMIEELLVVENLLYAYKILSEGFADWCTRSFYKSSERHGNAGKIYEKLRFGDGNSQWSRFSGVVDEIASRENVLRYLNREITYSEAKEIIKKSKTR